jgi:membrane protein
MNLLTVKGLKTLSTGKVVLNTLHLLWTALKKFDDDHGFFLSSGITFNLLICLVPLMLLFLSLAGIYLHSGREALNHIRSYFENAVPTLDPRIMNNIFKIIRDRKIVGILGIGGLIWTSTWVFSSLRVALNIVFRVGKGRGVVRGKTIDFLMVFLIIVLLSLSMSVSSGIVFVQKYPLSFFVDLGPITRFFLKYLIPFFFTYWIFFLIYEIIPNKKVPVKPALQAALFTSLSWEVAKQLFGWYVLHLGRFSMVYGSLGTLAIFFLWIYYSAAIVLFGGEIAYLLEKKSNNIYG